MNTILLLQSASVSILSSPALCSAECNRGKVDTLVYSAIFNFAVASISTEESVITQSISCKNSRNSSQAVYFKDRHHKLGLGYTCSLHSILFWHML